MTDYSDNEQQQETTNNSDDECCYYESDYTYHDDDDDKDNNYNHRSDQVLRMIEMETMDDDNGCAAAASETCFRNGANLKTTGLDDCDDEDDGSYSPSNVVIMINNKSPDHYATMTNNSAFLFRNNNNNNNNNAVDNNDSMICPACHSEAHIPVRDCQVVAAWVLKRNHIDTLSFQIILACLRRFIRQAARRFSVSEELAGVLCRRHGWNLDQIHRNENDRLQELQQQQQQQQQGAAAQEQQQQEEEEDVMSTEDGHDAKKAPEASSADDTAASANTEEEKEDSEQKLLTCAICYDNDFVEADMMSMDGDCGHSYCRDCWRGHLQAMLADGGAGVGGAGAVAINGGGGGALQTTCPDPNCRRVVTEVQIQQIAPELLPAFDSFQVQSFVQANLDTLRWCPGPDCGRIAVRPRENLFDYPTIAKGYLCGHCHTHFCFSCGERPHDGAGPCPIIRHAAAAAAAAAATATAPVATTTTTATTTAPAAAAATTASVVDTTTPTTSTVATTTKTTVSPATKRVKLAMQSSSVAAKAPPPAAAAAASGTTASFQPPAAGAKPPPPAAAASANGSAFAARHLLKPPPAIDAIRPTTLPKAASIPQQRPANASTNTGIPKPIKQCPRCRVDIEKTGGCNRMTCKCGHHFCWHCLADYASYSSHYCGGTPDLRQPQQERRPTIEAVPINLDYVKQTLREEKGRRSSDNNVDEEEDTTASPTTVAAASSDTAGTAGATSTTGAVAAAGTTDGTTVTEADTQKVLQQLKELERYAHCYNRFQAHGQGQLFCANQCTCVQGRADDYTRLAGIQTGTDIDFLTQANETLLASRRMLKYAYCSVYYDPASLQQQEQEQRVGSVANATATRPRAGSNAGHGIDKVAHLRFFHLEQLERYTEELSELSENSFSRRDRARVLELIRAVRQSMGTVAEFETHWGGEQQGRGISSSDGQQQLLLQEEEKKMPAT